MNKLTEALDVVLGVTPQDIGTADVTGAYVAVGNYREILATMVTASLTATKIAGISLLQATDASGTGAKALKAVVSSTAPTGNGVVIAEVGASVSELDSGFTHIAIKLTCNETAKVGAATVALGGKRYNS